jgi:hypothetical protein
MIQLPRLRIGDRGQCQNDNAQHDEARNYTRTRHVCGRRNLADLILVEPAGHVSFSELVATLPPCSRRLHGRPAVTKNCLLPQISCQ